MPISEALLDVVESLCASHGIRKSAGLVGDVGEGLGRAVSGTSIPTTAASIFGPNWVGRNIGKPVAGAVGRRGAQALYDDFLGLPQTASGLAGVGALGLGAGAMGAAIGQGMMPAAPQQPQLVMPPPRPYYPEPEPEPEFEPEPEPEPEPAPNPVQPPYSSALIPMLMPMPQFQALSKQASITDEEAQQALAHLHSLEENAPTSGALLRRAGVGAGLGTGLSLLTGTITGSKVPRPLQAATGALTGSIWGGVSPIINHELDRGADIGKLRKYLKQEGRLPKTERKIQRLLPDLGLL